MAFFLFLLVNVTLFFRPGEIVPAVAGWPIYEAVILGALALSIGPVFAQISGGTLSERPITVCVLGIGICVVLSHLAHFYVAGAQDAGAMFAKIVLYYLLLVALVDSAPRLRVFLICLAACILVLGSLPLLQEHGLISIDALSILYQSEIDSQTGLMTEILRLRGTGIYNDPNDLAMILVVGMLLGCYFLNDPRLKSWRLVTLPAIGAMGYAFFLTHSRGGMLALVTGVMVLLQARFGWRRMIPICAVALPLLLVVFGGRMTDISAVGDGTGQERVHLWQDGLALFRQHPFFGVGCNQFADHVGLVAHNSFLHCFAELGALGGSLFLASFGVACLMLFKGQAAAEATGDLELVRLRPYLLAILAGCSVSMLSISRPYVVPTYMFLGIATVWGRLCQVQVYWPNFRFDLHFMQRASMAAILFLAAMYLFTNAMVHS